MAADLEVAEVYGMRTVSFETQIYDGQVDEYTVSVVQGVSLRGRYNERVASCYTEVFDDEAVDQLISGIKRASSVIDITDLELFQPGGDVYTPVATFSEELEGITAEQKIEAARRMEIAALNADACVKQCDSCSIMTSLETTVLQNSLGLSLSSKSNVLFAICGVVIEDTESLISDFDVRGFHNFCELNPELIGVKTVEKAKLKMGSASIRSGNIPVIFSHEAMVDLLAPYQIMFDAEQAQLGLSLLSDKEGQDIFSPLITITDDPHHGLNLRSFDDEGVPTTKIDIVSRGAFITFMHNLRTARKAGIKSTGHAVRSYKSAIGIGASNLYIHPQDYTLTDLLKLMNNGLFITNLVGTHAGTNPISGDFSLLCNGMLVENGVTTRPVDRITVAGNFLIMMKNLVAVGNDLEFHPVAGSIGSPSIYVGELSIAGEE